MNSFTAKAISLSVDDRTRHWLYFTAVPRSNAERAASIHPEDVGGSIVSTDQTIHNGRGNDSLRLDDASFELVQCPTNLPTEDFYKIQSGDVNIMQRYYDEVEEFVAQKLGCDKVICVHSQVRSAAKAGTNGVQGYAGGGPHTDSSAISGDMFALDVLKNHGQEGTRDQYQRYCYLNLWRNIGDRPIENNHLACLDERTVVKPDDYVIKDLFGDGYEVVQYGLNARHAEHHKWYYFPKMTKNEGILFKQMDSDWTKSGRTCFHMSVSDPDAPTDGPDRESIEVRMLCLWKNAAVNSMPTEENIHRDLIKSPKDYAIQLKGSALTSASFLQLVLAILAKLPLVGSIFGHFIGLATATAEYTGNPPDYSDRFITAFEAFDSWPQFGKSWVKTTMKQSKTVQAGIETITQAVVDDAMGYQKTKNLPSKAKAEIAEFLLGNDKYMQLCQKHIAPLASSD
ncbi:expressed unknown protein [Seminavis robusta]|uniref:Uncharacterized protein n=1 Tax=Seminavis robusta TaxID=568900 RepID=A0A9N8EE25_9STRA|nr:expressed unknown protein [Seminavis robusta]|eukprot:Sro859_g212070.1 n/a (455) ;mRNA; f:41234-42598